MVAIFVAGKVSLTGSKVTVPASPVFAATVIVTVVDGARFNYYGYDCIGSYAYRRGCR